jgi:anti-sigma-K factor RskA
VSNCDQFREIYEAYALGALDAAECEAFEAHLATGCKNCAKAIEEARWVVSQLAYLAPEAAPSDMLKGRLMQTVRAEALSALQASPKRSAVIPPWMWAAVAAMLLLTLYSSWNANRLAKEVTNTQERAAAILQERRNLEAQLEAAKREALIVTDPASITIPMKSADPALPALEAKWHAKLGIVLTGQSVQAPSGDRVLQLWLIPKSSGGKPIPSLVVRPDANGKFALLVANPPELMAATKALAVTEEPAGGSAQPTTAPRWVGGVS